MAALTTAPVPASAQAYHNFAGNLAMSRVTMQPVNAQRLHTIRVNSRGYAAPSPYARFGAPRGAYAGGNSLNPAMRARIVAAVRRAYLQRMVANSVRYRALAAQ